MYYFKKNIIINDFYIGFNLLFFVFLFYFFDKNSLFKKDLEDITVFDSILMEYVNFYLFFLMFQVLYITIIGARILKLKKFDSLKFSFFLAIPTIIGAII